MGIPEEILKEIEKFQQMMTTLKEAVKNNQWDNTDDAIINWRSGVATVTVNRIAALIEEQQASIEEM